MHCSYVFIYANLLLSMLYSYYYSSKSWKIISMSIFTSSGNRLQFKDLMLPSQCVMQFLDENKNLIVAILENQNLGKIQECARWATLVFFLGSGFSNWWCIGSSSIFIAVIEHHYHDWVFVHCCPSTKFSKRLLDWWKRHFLDNGR